MSKLKFLHGSGAVPQDPSEFTFSLFNYNYDSINKKANHRSVNSGLDAEGPGIYAFGQPSNRRFTEQQNNSAHGYAGKDGEGSVWGFTVDMTDADGNKLKTADKVRPDAIPAHEWVDVMEFMVDGIRRLKGYEPAAVESTLSNLLDRWQSRNIPPTQADFESLNAVAAHGLYWSENDPAKYPHPYAWEMAVRQHLEFADPASFILEQSGEDFEYLADQAIESSDNLWETLKNIWNWTAVERRGNNYNSYNALLLEAVRAKVTDSDLLRVASVNHGNFYVIFDTHSIQPQFAKVFTHDIDKPIFSDMLNKIGEMLEVYGRQLERPQIKNKLTELTRKYFGTTLSEPILDRLSNARSAESIESGLLERMKDELSHRVETLWEIQPGVAEKFKPAPAPQVDAPEAAMRRRM